MNSKSLVVHPRLQVGNLVIEPKRVKATYTVFKRDGSVEANELIYTFEEAVFDPKDAGSINLASMMVAQLAINYGLFFDELVFNGLFDAADQRFILDMVENTSREIYVIKFLHPNEFLIPPYNELEAVQQDNYTNATILFVNTGFEDKKAVALTHAGDQNSYVILSSGGKDSLLSYGLAKELGTEAHPIFVNESGRHWFTALNAYRHFKATEPNTGRVWSNSDRLFNWMLRQLPFIRQDFQNVRADIYPLRLWTVAVFLFGVLPLAIKRKAGRILIGDEFDTSIKGNLKGITHYSGLYDQSKYFDNALSRYYHKKDWHLIQISMLRSLGELLILKILVKRYPDLQRHQISCHAAHEEDGRLYPCGNCEKCRRIIGMLKALDEDPRRCGYNSVQIEKGLKSLEQKGVKQLGSDAAHLYFLLLGKGLLEVNEHTGKLAKAHPEIMKLRFDKERSNLADLPYDIRQPLITLFLQYADGAVQLTERKWEALEEGFVESRDFVYPFEKINQ